MFYMIVLKVVTEFGMSTPHVISMKPFLVIGPFQLSLQYSWFSCRAAHHKTVIYRIDPIAGVFLDR